MNIFKNLKSKVEADVTAALRKEFQPEIDELRARAETLKEKARRAEWDIHEATQEAHKTMKSVRRNSVLAVVFTAVAAVASVTAAVAACRK